MQGINRSSWKYFRNIKNGKKVIFLWWHYVPVSRIRDIKDLRALRMTHFKTRSSCSLHKTTWQQFGQFYKTTTMTVPISPQPIDVWVGRTQDRLNCWQYMQKAAAISPTRRKDTLEIYEVVWRQTMCRTYQKSTIILAFNVSKCVWGKIYFQRGLVQVIDEQERANGFVLLYAFMLLKPIANDSLPTRSTEPGNSDHLTNY